MDTCIFYCSHDVVTPTGTRREYLFIGCYVDDLFVLSSHNDEHSLYCNFTRDLQDEWDVEDEGEVSDLLSVEITREEDHVVLRQQGYIEKMMRNFAPDGVPTFLLDKPYLLSDHPSSRTPAEDGRHGLPQLVADALTQDAADIDPALLKAYQSLRRGCVALLCRQHPSRRGLRGWDGVPCHG